MRDIETIEMPPIKHVADKSTRFAIDISDKSKLKENAVKILHAHGFTMREIMMLLHYKSHRAVSYLLEK